VRSRSGRYARLGQTLATPGIDASRARIDRIMTAAKASDRLLTEEELDTLARLD